LFFTADEIELIFVSLKEQISKNKSQHMNLRIYFMMVVLLTMLSSSLSAESCPDTVVLSITTAYEDQQLVVTVRAKNFTKMSAFQFGLNYDADVFDFLSADSPLPSFSPNVYTDNGNGNIRFVWIDADIEGTTYSDGTGILELRFAILQESSTSFIEISRTQLPVEFINNDSESLCVKTAVIQASSKGTFVEGGVWNDVNSNCLGEAGEEKLSDWLIEISRNGQKLYRTTDSSGNYSIILPAGTYTFRLVARNDSWSICDDKTTVVVVGENVIQQDFVVKAKVTCPVMSVDLSTPILQRCAENTYNLAIENQGTATAESVRVELVSDQYLQFVRTDASSFSQSGNVLSLSLGDVLPGTKLNYQVVFALDCATTKTGQTHCVTASVVPRDLCVPAPSWSGAELSIQSECDEVTGKVIFHIANQGSGNMSSARSYIVTEDDVMTPPQPVMLDAQEELTVELPADGTTWRITAGQDLGYPFASLWTTMAVEGCGEDGSGKFTTGYVTQFEESDRDLFLDSECRESVSSYPEVSITGYHRGYGPEKLVQNETHLEYVLRFQNRSTDTALTVLVKNPLPATLDITTLQMGASSHPYTYRINQQRELMIQFDHILLPDSATNESASQGFIRYTVYPMEGLPDGTRIENKAAIYFDYNTPRWTEVEFHTIASNFVMTSVEWTGTEAGVTFYPNPVQEQLVLDLSAEGQQKAEYYITDASGKILAAGSIYNIVHIIPCDHFPPGQYVVRVAFENGRSANFFIIKR
jgi:hypothetical protein